MSSRLRGHDVAAGGVGLGRLEEGDDFLMALFQPGDVALDLLEMLAGFLARGGNGLALLGFLALLFLGLEAGTFLARRGDGGLGGTGIGQLLAGDEALLFRTGARFIEVIIVIAGVGRELPGADVEHRPARGRG